MNKITIFVILVISLSTIESLGASYGLDDDKSTINVFLLDRITLSGSWQLDSKTINVNESGTLTLKKDYTSIYKIKSEYSISPFNIWHRKNYDSDKNIKYKFWDSINFFFAYSYGNTFSDLDVGTLNTKTRNKESVYSGGVRIETKLRDVFRLFIK